jgi:hypothetical protein
LPPPSVWLTRRARFGDTALAGLVASMPEPSGRLAVDASASLVSPSAEFDRAASKRGRTMPRARSESASI